MSTARACDVLIVGAGPTGSTLALMLAQAGVDVVLADREADIYPLPRAAHIDSEALRIFQSIGLAAPIVASCRHAPRYDFVNAAGDVLLRFDGADRIGAGGWPASNMIHQPSIERALRDAVIASDWVELRPSHRLIALSQDDQIAATFTAPGGEETIRARFVVGADGARSAVRTLSGMAVDDLGFDEPWLVIDALVHDASRLPDINLQICDPDRPTTCVLMGEGRHRWEFMLKPGETAEQVTDPAFVRSLLQPWNVDGAIAIERTAVYRFSAHVATRWRHGRVLLAGDSAHLMPPFAGQGMCSGLRDAANLAWKLAAILRDRASEAGLLASYQQEREPHVRAIIGLAMMMGRTVCLLDHDAAAARDTQMLAARASGRPGPQAGNWPPFAAGGILPGTPASGSYFPQAVTDEVRLDDVLGSGAWLIARSDVPACDDLSTITIDRPVLAPFCATLASWLDAQAAAAVLVRPDRYVFGTGDPDTLVCAWRAFLAARDDAADTILISARQETNMALDGTYDVTVKSPLGEQKSVLVVKTEDDTFTGTNTGANGSFDISGTVRGDTLSWQQAITTPMPMTLDMTATIDGDTLTGSAKAGAFGSFAMTGTRTA